MYSIDKPTAYLLAELLHLYGVRHVVLSPGTRSAPLALVFSRSGYFDIKVVIDERSAAFIALGMALRLDGPVALLCTSGSAMLNYAPALAEAYYRRVSLIAISADRPADLIDQRDSQTLRQSGALAAVVRKSVDIADDHSDNYLRYANRMINEALYAAVGPICGPVHINMQFAAPLTSVTENPAKVFPRKINIVRPVATYDFSGLLSTIPAESKVLVVCGDIHPSDTLGRLLTDTEKMAVYAEVQSNAGQGVHPWHPDMDSMPAPDIVVSVGGSLVSGRVKSYLRSQPALRHISVGYDDNIVDTFFSVTDIVECPPEDFLMALENHLRPERDFVRQWNFSGISCEDPVVEILQHIVSRMKDADFHFSNGSSIRYAQTLRFDQGQRVDANRGVSGIDGCTSTAIGSAMVSDRDTILVTGDMSAAYDVGALAVRGIPSSFKIVVLDNNGGDIFRAIKSTGHLPECENLFAASPHLPLKALAQAYGFRYFEAVAGQEYDISEFINTRQTPAILRIVIPAGSAKSVL